MFTYIATSFGVAPLLQLNASVRSTLFGSLEHIGGALDANKTRPDRRDRHLDAARHRALSLMTVGSVAHFARGV